MGGQLGMTPKRSGHPLLLSWRSRLKRRLTFLGAGSRGRHGSLIGAVSENGGQRE